MHEFEMGNSLFQIKDQDYNLSELESLHAEIIHSSQLL